MNEAGPKFAIIDPNTLAAMGLKQLLQSLIPMLEIDTFDSMAAFCANHPEAYLHYFVAMNIVLENRDFFMEHRRKTIVLTMTADGSRLSDFHCISVNVSESLLVRQLLMLEQKGHGGRSHIPIHRGDEPRLLTDREAEVMVLIVKGFINKEIADQLHIGLSTVITHRKNIMEKLGVKSVSSLTIYAVMHGYVDISKI